MTTLEVLAARQSLVRDTAALLQFHTAARRQEAQTAMLRVLRAIDLASDDEVRDQVERLSRVLMAEADMMPTAGSA